MAGLLARFGRRHSKGPDQRDFRIWLERFLELLDAEAAQDPEPTARPFREQLQRFGFQIALGPDPAAPDGAGQASLAAGRRHGAARRAAAAEREAGYRGVIRTLT